MSISAPASQLSSTSASSRVVDLGLLVLIGMIWGSSFVSMKVLSTEVEPLTISAVRLAVAVVLLQLWRLQRGRGRTEPAGQYAMPTPWRSLAIIAFLGQALPFSLIAWAETRISASLTAILMAFGPIFGLFLSHFTTEDDPMTVPKVVCGVAGFMGILLLSAQSGLNSNTGALVGELAALVASMSYVFGGVTTRKLDSMPTDLQTVLVMTIATTMLLPLACLFEHPWTLHLSSGSVLALAYLGAIPTAMGFFLRFVLIKRAGYIFVSFLGYLTPISGLALGVIFLGEAVHLRSVLALMLVIGGLLVVRMSDIAELIRNKPLKRR